LQVVRAPRKISVAVSVVSLSMRAHREKMITDEALITELREILASSEPFPIDLDDVSRWLVYKLRQRLVTILTSKFILNVHYTEGRLDHCVSFRDKDYKKYYISIECFEKFCKFRKGSRGRKVHVMLLDLKKEEFSRNEEVEQQQAQPPEEEENNVEDEVDESEWSSSSESASESEDDDGEEVPSTPLLSSPSPASNSKDILATPPSLNNNDKHQYHHQEEEEEEEEEEDEIERECNSHKRHLDELEEVWTRQNAKMQRVLDKIDDRTPLEEMYWFTPNSTITNNNSVDNSQNVPDYLSPSLMEQNFSDDDNDHEHAYHNDEDDVLRLLNL